MVEAQGTEQTRAHGVHLGFLYPVIQLKIREAAAGGLDESWVMLQPRMPANQQSAARAVGIAGDFYIEKRRILQRCAGRQLAEIPAAHRRTSLVRGLRQPLQSGLHLAIIPGFLIKPPLELAERQP